MPKLLTNPEPRKKPPCGRTIKYHVPHSPFQKLIDGRMKSQGLTCPDLAEPMGVHRGTVWIWLHNANGFPHPKSFKEHHVGILAKTLKLDPVKIIEALDASRHLYTPREAAPVPQRNDQFDTLIKALEKHPRPNIRVRYVINLAKRLKEGVPPNPGVLRSFLEPTASAD